MTVKNFTPELQTTLGEGLSVCHILNFDRNFLLLGPSPVVTPILPSFTDVLSVHQIPVPETEEF